MSRNQIPHTARAYGQNNTANKIVRTVLHSSAQLSSSAIGTLFSSIPLDPSTSADWGDFSSTYDEFRVAGVEMVATSLLQNSLTAANNLGVVAFDNDSAAVPTSVNQIAQFSTATYLPAIFQHSGGKVWKQQWWRPTSGGETAQVWYDVGAPAASPGAILIAFDTLTATTAYLTVFFRYYLEFRGRR